MPFWPRTPQTTNANAAGTTQRGDAARPVSPWMVFSATSLGLFICFTNSSSLNVVLPVIGRYFSVGPSTGSWILVSYMLVTTVLILIFGRLADMLGRRFLFLLGVALFGLGGLGCGLVSNVGWLIAFRCLQAAGAAAVITNTSALLTDVFPKAQLGTAIGLSTTVAAASQVLGPVIGGALATAFGWRAVFLFNVPIAAITFLWAWRMVPAIKPGNTGGFDAIGAALATVVLGGLVTGLAMGGPLGWGSWTVLLSFIIAFIGLPFLVATQVARPDPLIDVTLFRDPRLRVAFITIFIVSTAQSATTLLIGVFLQSAQGYTSFDAGARLIPMAIAMMAMATLTGRLLRRMPPVNFAVAGLAISSLGLMLFAIFLQAHLAVLALLMLLLVVGIGVGTFITPNTSSILASVQPHRRGIANGVRSASQNTGYMVGAALSLSLITAPLTEKAQRAVYAGALHDLTPQDIVALVGGYHTAFSVMAAATLIGLGLVVWVESGLRRRGVPPQMLGETTSPPPRAVSAGIANR